MEHVAKAFESTGMALSTSKPVPAFVSGKPVAEEEAATEQEEPQPTLVRFAKMYIFMFSRFGSVVTF
jgi:hypothetical protein